MYDGMMPNFGNQRCPGINREGSRIRAEQRTVCSVRNSIIFDQSASGNLISEISIHTYHNHSHPRLVSATVKKDHELWMAEIMMFPFSRPEWYCTSYLPELVR